MSKEFIVVERHDGKMTLADRTFLEDQLSHLIPWVEQDDAADDYQQPWTYNDQSEALESLPIGAALIAEFSAEEEHPFTSWKNDVMFYTAESKPDSNIFCLLKLNWNDNFSHWEFSCVASMTFHAGVENVNAELMSNFAKVALKTAGGGAWEDFLQSWV